jgi:membrane protease YdiL (CAAX protease family)
MTFVIAMVPESASLRDGRCVIGARRLIGPSLSDVTQSDRPSRPEVAAIDVRVAALVWLFTWFAGQLLGGLILSLSTDVAIDESGDDRSIGVVALALLATWAAYSAGLWWASRTAGSGDVGADYRWGIRFLDLWAIPVGVVTQLLLVPGVYVPFERIWPEVFSQERLEENARRLVESASGLWLPVLVILVVCGAPLIEEFVYRGLLQQSLATRFSAPIAVVIGATWFALIHFRPVEFPGLFVAGLVFGAALMWTGRLGTAVVAHASFNLAGLALVWRG